MEGLPPVLHMSKRYHRAKFPLTVRSLNEFLSSYQPNSYDESLEDPITWCTQEDHFKGAIPLPPIEGIYDIMCHVPVMCRTITLCKPLYPGMNMNPWLGRVQSLPGILRFISTSDFVRFKDKLHDKERINCAMLITKNPSGSILACGVGKHISSVLLTGDQGSYHPDADLATWAMVIVHMLTQPSQPTWMSEELKMIEDMHGYVYRHGHSSWAKYLHQVKSNDFRLSLVTQSRSLPAWSQCPHLNKFLLACYFLRNELDPEQMEQRRNAAITEFFGRVYKPELLTVFYEGRFSATADEILNSIPLDLKITLRETVRAFAAKLDNYDFKSVELNVVEPTQDTVRNGHMNLSCAMIVNVFQRMCPAIVPLDDSVWRQLLVTGMHVQDSFKRNTTEHFELNRDKLISDIRSELVSFVVERTAGFVFRAYWRGIGQEGWPFETEWAWEYFQDVWLNEVIMCLPNQVQIQDRRQAEDAPVRAGPIPVYHAGGPHRRAYRDFQREQPALPGEARPRPEAAPGGQ